MLIRNKRWPHLTVNLSGIRSFFTACLIWLLPIVVHGQFTDTNGNGTLTVTGYNGSGGSVVIPAAIFTYSTINGTLTVTAYNGPGGAVVIPAVVEGIPVTGIADDAFSSSSIMSVDISSNINDIADDAFLDCLSLTNIIVDVQNTNYSSLNGVLFNQLQTVLVQYPAGNAGTFYAVPAGVTNIEDYAFFDCASLANVTIPASVTSVGPYAFYGCSSLTNFGVDLENTNFSSVNGVWFDLPQTTLIQYPAGATATTYSVPGSVTNIAGFAFRRCNNLVSVTLPYGINSLGQQAFGNCGNLAGITIPGSVTGIGNGAFENCAGLASLVLSNGVAAIGQQAFNGCASLTNVVIPASITNIGDTAFGYCTSLTNITVDSQNTVYSSSGGVLFDYSGKTLIQYPAGVAETAYTIPASVTTIGDYAFFYSLIENVTIDSSVTNIEQGAFDYCVNLAGITIPAGVTTVGAYVFYNCFNLATASIAGNITSLGDNAFFYCSHLTSITLPASITCIRPGTFCYCSSLTNVVISGSVTNIGPNAFSFCSSLGAITLPASISSIGDNAFQYCRALKNVYFEGNAVYDDGTIFNSDSGTVYYLSGTTGWGPTFSGLPTAVWTPSAPPTICLNNPFAHGGQFGFTISGATNLMVVVETCTNPKSSVWVPLQTNSIGNGTFNFTDTTWTNATTRYYRVHSF